MSSLPHPGPSFEASETAVFVEPSHEAKCLVRHFGWLVAPEDGRGNLVSRAVGVVLVAPFTQLTFFSFDLQAFLYDVFHTTRWARLGHLVCMPVVNLSVMVALAQLRVGPHPEAHTVEWLGLNGATAYAALLLAWYLALAARTRLWLWGAAMVPVVAALAVAANVLYGSTFVLEEAARPWYAPTPLAYNPFLWMTVAAFLIAASHGPEPRLPPRVTESPAWQSVPDYVLGPPGARHPPARRVVRALRVGMQAFWGTLDEWWASPRLMPYGVLMLMFRAGYRPDLRAVLDERVHRAQASGNPALDYVGTGGGAFLPRG